MCKIIALVIKSLLNRRLTALLTILTVAMSVMLVLGVDRVRVAAKSSFNSTVSGAHVLVGARSGPIHLLLYSIFGIGQPVRNLTWQTYQKIAGHEQVEWSLPISLGDSHRGFRVVGTIPEFFERFKHGDKQNLKFVSGRAFSGLFDAVVGAEVARTQGYELGKKIILSHGVQEAAFLKHDNLNFEIIGILKRTGTPVDKMVLVDLAAIEAIHHDWQQGAPPSKKDQTSADALLGMEHVPDQVTAVLVKLKSLIAIPRFQREWNEYDKEALTALLPAVTLLELWKVLDIGERALRLVGLFVVVAGLLGVMTSLLSTLSERRREMSILRAVGASPRFIFILLVVESFLLVGLGVLLGWLIFFVISLLSTDFILANWGIYLKFSLLTVDELWFLAGVLVAGVIVGLVPGAIVYRNTLSDGLSAKT